MQRGERNVEAAFLCKTEIKSQQLEAFFGSPLASNSTSIISEVTAWSSQGST